VHMKTFFTFIAILAYASVGASAQELHSFTKPASATKRIQMPFGQFALWVDDSQWKPDKSNKVSELVFDNINGEGYAKAIVDRIGIPLPEFRNVVLSNMRSVDQNAKVVLEEKRIVNGKQILALQIDVTSMAVPFRFYGYCYTGTSGSLQIWTWTAQSVFADNAEGFAGFLNGLEISDQELPAPPSPSLTSVAPPGVLSFNAGKMGLKYDPQKWKQTHSNETNRFTFEHSSGGAYAMIIAERIEVPVDTLANIALTNAQSLDPNAKIVFREKRKVNGVEVWLLKIEAESSGIPFAYCGYYFGGKSGTVQVITYTGKNLLGEYEKDFMEFLNGLQISDAPPPAVQPPPAPEVQGSAIELKSDPMGVDFRPYLTQILATIRRNWYGLMPETVELGDHGKVGLLFAIAKGGDVTKVTWAFQSGSESLDKAAVAAISASNPFPPLPAEYKGERVVLQLNFTYNAPK
jgi:TonB family protein